MCEGGRGIYSLSHEAFGHNAELPAPVLDQVAVLGHHHVVELLALLGDHHIGVPLHAQFKAWCWKRIARNSGCCIFTNVDVSVVK